jgi:LSD1 subclass zinc finger protein
MANKIDLAYFKCSLGFENDHFLFIPIPLYCGHSACESCVESLKLNTGLKNVECNICKNMNSLDICYRESLIAKNYMEYGLDKISRTLEQDFENNSVIFQSKNIIYSFFSSHFVNI